MAADVDLARAHLRAAMASLVAASAVLGEPFDVGGTEPGPARGDASTGRVERPPGRPTPPGQRACAKCGNRSWQRLGSIAGGAEEVVCGFCATPQGNE